MPSGTPSFNLLLPSQLNTRGAFRRQFIANSSDRYNTPLVSSHPRILRAEGMASARSAACSEQPTSPSTDQCTTHLIISLSLEPIGFLLIIWHFEAFFLFFFTFSFSVATCSVPGPPTPTPLQSLLLSLSLSLLLLHLERSGARVTDTTLYSSCGMNYANPPTQ